MPPVLLPPAFTGLEKRGADPEALIKEARERQRRRRRRVLALMLALAALGGIAYGIVRVAGGGAKAIERLPDGPVVNVAAFAHHGELAFISHNTLWLLNGRAGSLHALPTPGSGVTPEQPSFSADGKWLGYLQRRQNASTGEQYARVWIAHGDGTHAHVVPGMQVDELFGWSPTSDILAVSTGPERTKKPCPCYSPTTLRFVSPDGSSRPVAHASWLYGAAWSPDGRRIAVAAMNRSTARIVSYPEGGGSGQVWLTRRTHQRLNGMNEIILGISGWWRHVGIGAWAFGDGMVHNNDASPLDAVAAPGATARLLGQTLSDGTTDAVAASVNGDVAIVTDHGGGRSAWQGKTIELCTATGPCRALPHAPRDVTVDPAWSPDGRTLAYVEAPNVSVGPWSQKAIAVWYAAHHVLLYDAKTGRTRGLAAAHGATAITWSRTGTSLLYVRNDSLWLLPTLTGEPVRVAAPLFPHYNWPQYYAQIAWNAQFSWWAP